MGHHAPINLASSISISLWQGTEVTSSDHGRIRFFSAFDLSSMAMTYVADQVVMDVKIRREYALVNMDYNQRTLRCRSIKKSDNTNCIERFAS